jgi:hypothetical protein
MARLPDCNDIINARKATAVLRGPAAACVRALLAEDALLPPEAWSIFVRALRCTAVCTQHLDWPDFLDNLLRLIRDLPARIEHLDIAGDESDSYQLSPSCTVELAAALLASSAAGCAC